jgi:hypothetical protein
MLGACYKLNIVESAAWLQNQEFLIGGNALAIAWAVVFDLPGVVMSQTF